MMLLLLMGPLRAAPEIFPLSEVKPGMQGTVYTVMQGTEIVPIEAEILGILEGGLGPGRDMIIGKLVDEKTQLTGAVHGMSGSPLMVDGKLVGALSRRLGVFEKDGHCGFTPAEQMIDVVRRGHRGKFQTHPGALNSLQMPLTVSGGADQWDVLEDKFGEWFPDFFPVVGGVSGKSEKAMPDFKAGSAMAVVLMDGDISLSATGTVTWVKDKQVVGFGHAMFGLGPVALPIAPAEIITILPSYMMPHKISNAGTINGTLDQDRHSAVSGRIGPVPDMATYQIRRKHNNEIKPAWSGRLVKHELLSPQLISILGANAMLDAQDVSYDFSMRAKTRIVFDKLPEYLMEGYYSGTPRERMLGLFDQLMPLMKLMGTYGKQMQVESVEFDVETIEMQKSWTIESMDISADEVKVGERLNLVVILKNELGDRKTLQTKWSPPEELRNHRVLLEVVSGTTLNLTHQNSSVVTRAACPEDALRFLEMRYDNQKIYIAAVKPSSSLIKSGQIQAGLPHTVRLAALENPSPSTISSSGRLEYTAKSLSVDGMVLGCKTQMVRIK